MASYRSKLFCTVVLITALLTVGTVGAVPQHSFPEGCQFQSKKQKADIKSNIEQELHGRARKRIRQRMSWRASNNASGNMDARRLIPSGPRTTEIDARPPQHPRAGRRPYYNVSSNPFFYETTYERVCEENNCSSKGGRGKEWAARIHLCLRRRGRLTGCGLASE